MSIAFFNPPIEFYSPVSGGAIATVIAEVTRVLENQGEKVTVLTRADGNDAYPYGEVIRLGPCGREDLNFIQRRMSYWRSRSQDWDWPYFDYYRDAVTAALTQLPNPPDALVLFNDLSSPAFLRALLPGTKIFVWLHNEQRSWQADLSVALAATSGWLTCSEYIRTWAIREHRLPPAKTFTLLNGVNLDQFHPRPDFDAPRSVVRVLFVGRLDPNKGPDLAVEAVATLRAEGLPVTITVAGGKWFYPQPDESGGGFEQTLHRKITAAAGEALGHVPRTRIAEVIREHDIVCVLSRSQEPFGLVVLEAMASGCAVVASARGGLAEACAGAALLVDPERPIEIADALRRLVTEPDTLAEYKRRGLGRAQAGSWENTAELLRAQLPHELAAA